jgi:adenosylhomocysteine nucleosidase
VVALPAEAETLGGRKSRAGDSFEVAGGAVIVCGIGPRRAAAAAERLVARGARALLSWGTAGGLSSALRCGDIMIPERVLTPDNHDGIAVDADWRARTVKELATRVPVSSGALWSSREPVTAVEAKRVLSNQGMAAVDMESGAVASVANRNGLPFFAVKAICDPAERALPAALLGLMDADGTFRPRGLSGLLRGGIPAWRAAGALRADFAAARQALKLAAEALPVILQP